MIFSFSSIYTLSLRNVISFIHFFFYLRNFLLVQFLHSEVCSCVARDVISPARQTRLRFVSLVVLWVFMHSISPVLALLHAPCINLISFIHFSFTVGFFCLLHSCHISYHISLHFKTLFELTDFNGLCQLFFIAYLFLDLFTYQNCHLLSPFSTSFFFFLTLITGCSLLTLNLNKPRIYM